MRKKMTMVSCPKYLCSWFKKLWCGGEKQPEPEAICWHYYSRGAASPEKPGYYRVGVMNGNVGYATTKKWNGSEWENTFHEEVIAWRELLEKERQYQDAINAYRATKSGQRG